jgi:uncharacterized membrane protein
MATITVLKFGTVGGADEALKVIQDLTKQHLITLQDAAIVTWQMGKKKPKTRQMANRAGLGALDGAFWGMLFGIIFFVPLFGAAVGTAMGALAGSFADVGIDDNFINLVQAKVTEDTSALFLMTSDAMLDQVSDAMREMDFELIASNLSREQVAQLTAVFVHN